MKNLLPLGLSLAAAMSFLVPVSLSAQIINIDFRAFRAAEGEPGNASGDPSGFVGGGTTYNGLVADDSAERDNITVAGTDLVDSHNKSTSINFSISPVGADDNGLGVFNGSDLFTNSANNLVASASFTISGLDAENSVNLIFFTTSDTDINVPAVTFGASTTAATPTSIANEYTYEFDNVPVIGDEVTGTIGTPNPTPFQAYPLILSGLAIEAPEPSTWTRMGVAGGFLLGRRPRRESTV
jgi:hypothetical protein